MTVFSQPASSWVGVPGVLHTSPSTTKVGIGTSTPNAMLHIRRPNLLSSTVDSSSSQTQISLEHTVGVSSTVSWNMRTSGGLGNYSFMLFPNNNATRFVVRSDGKFGINGNPNSSTTLMVHGGGIFRSKLEISDPSANNKISFFHDGVNYRIESEGTGELLFNYSSAKQITFHPNVKISGNLMIGTNSYSDGTHDYKLNINGKVRATDIKCYTGWADFVFDPNYKLIPLSQVKTYTQQYKHLPDLPSEKEVAQNGIFLAEMNAKLLQKIEELYLYVFELEDRIRAIEKNKQK